MITKRYLQLQIEELGRDLRRRLVEHTHSTADISIPDYMSFSGLQPLGDVLGNLRTRLRSLEIALGMEYRKQTPPHHVRAPKKAKS